MPSRPGIALKIALTAIIGCATLTLLIFIFFGELPGTGYSADVREVNLAADGNVLVGTIGETNLDYFLLAQGTIVVRATDMQGNLSTGSDLLAIDAVITEGNNDYRLEVRQIMPEDPFGLHETWGGVGIDTTPQLPPGESPWLDAGVRAGFIGYGYGTLTCHGEILRMGVPVRVMTIASPGFPWNARLVLDIGFEDMGRIDRLPASGKDMRVMWDAYTDEIPEDVQLQNAAQVCP